MSFSMAPSHRPANPPHSGRCVMFGLGGMLTEMLDDAIFRIAPLWERDALATMDRSEVRQSSAPSAAQHQQTVHLLQGVGMLRETDDPRWLRRRCDQTPGTPRLWLPKCLSTAPTYLAVIQLDIR